ncbi:hypothetical protein Q5H93_19305 [Hymenobacter sp. ASUV-10]|uniref:Uncharacterized protein n=1 Tax=Hymenobacter aranciens TaxID=3063996 RepID=A0ABT9BF90_9BACT|nr:hypothetical protein [Hymenobacter sp. ASUV-10]MDO7876902.1 hypothetical protein [Hymenobacter sp. ASUV-10]
MSTTTTTTIPHDVIVQRAYDFYALGVLRQTTLAGADNQLTMGWFADLKTKTDAAVLLPSYAQLRAADSQFTVQRNAHIKEARGLMQDLFYYAKKAYPQDTAPDEYFGHSKYTRAGSNPVEVLKVMQSAVAALTTRYDALLNGGMAKEKLDRLIGLTGLAQTDTTSQRVAEGTTSVATSNTGREFEELWNLCRLVAEAAVVAYRTDAVQRRLFLLYPDGPEERSLTLQPGTGAAPTIKALVLDSMLSAGRRLSITIEAPGGPVRVLLHNPAMPYSPDGGTALAATDKNKPHRCKAASLGWVQAGDQELVVINDTAAKVCLKIRVLEVGE